MKKKSLRGCKKKKINIETDNILLKSFEILNKHKTRNFVFVSWKTVNEAKFVALRKMDLHIIEYIPRSIDTEVNILNGSSIITLLIDFN